MWIHKGGLQPLCGDLMVQRRTGRLAEVCRLKDLKSNANKYEMMVLGRE